LNDRAFESHIARTKLSSSVKRGRQNFYSPPASRTRNPALAHKRKSEEDKISIQNPDWLSFSGGHCGNNIVAVVLDTDSD